MPVVYKSNTVNSGFQVQMAAQVSVECEKCGATYAYTSLLTGYSSTKLQAAQDNLSEKVKQVQAGKYSLVADFKPCPLCGYVQSWMLEPVRRKRGWMYGVGVAMLVCFAAILIEALLLPANIRDNAVQGIFLVAVVPVIVFFIARLIVMKTYRPNREVASRTNTPRVSFGG